MLLYRIKKILSDENNTVFLFEGFLPIYQVIPEILEKMNYKLKDVFLISNKIRKTNLAQLNLVTTQISKANKVLQPILNKKDFKSRIPLIVNLGVKYAKLVLKKNVFLKMNSNYKDVIKKKFENKFIEIKNIDCVFFLTASREDAFLKPVYSILNELGEQKRDFKIVVSEITTGLNLFNKNIPYFDIFEIIQVISKLLEIDKDGQTIKNEIQEELIQAKPLGYKTMENYLIKEAFRAYALLKICEYIISKTNPNSILVSDDGEILGNAAIQVSKKFNITSYALHTNLTTYVPIFSDWFHADKIFTYGNDGMRILKQLNYNLKRIKIVGNPRNDSVHKINQNEIKNQLSKKFHINKTKKIILLAQSLWHNDDEIWISKLINFCEKNDLEIIIKIHPRYQVRSHEFSESKIEKIKKITNKNTINYSYDYDFSSLASCAEVIITDFSYAGIDAILLGKPIILVNFLNNEKYNIVRECLKNSKMTDEAKNFEELESMLQKVLKNEFLPDNINLENEINEFNFQNDGNASKRIVEYLINKN